MARSDFTNQFLIAMPGLSDPDFHRTMAYVCIHNEDGAMGVIVNKPLNLQLSQILEQMDIKSNNAAINQQAVYSGGPVQTDRGFVLHPSTKKWESTIVVNNEISVTTSKDILEDIAYGNGPKTSLIALGYAGWQPGQLEQEIIQNAWLCSPSDAQIIFDTPHEQRWGKAVDAIGIDISKLSSEIGHA